MAVKKFNTRIQLKNDTSTNWSSAGSLVLLKGEFAWNSDLNNFKIGNGQSAFSALNYVLPAFGNTLTPTTTDGITTYNVNIDGTSIVKDSNGVLSAVAAATPYKLTVGSMEYNGGANREIKVGTGLEFSPASGASDNITILHSTSGVTADTYGSTTAIPVITVDAQGHVTSATTSAITVGDGALALTGDSWLTVGTGTGFNANSDSDVTYTIAHAAVTPNDTTATSTIVPGGTAVLLSVASDAAGHITGKTETTATFATVNVASASATGFFADAKEVKDYVDNKTADLSGAMHFRSIITTTGSSDYVDQINTYYGGSGVPAAEVGDVFVDTTSGKEYVVKSLPGSGSLTAANIEEFGSVNPETTVASFKASTSTTGLTVTPTTDTTGAVTMTVDATSGYGIPTTTQLTKIDNIAVTANSVTDGTTTLNFASVAWTGAAADVSIADAGSLITASTVEGALQELAQGITNSQTTIDGASGAFTIGNGLVNASKNISVLIDSTNANGLSVGANGVAMAAATETTYGTVKVDDGNGLTYTNDVIAYAHNTDAVTIASKDASNVVTINGTFTPNASDAITMSNPITLAPVAVTGSAAQLAVTSGNYGGDTAVTNAQDALTNLSTAMGSHTHNISDLTEDSAISTGDNTVIFDCGTATTCTNTVSNS